MPLLEVDELHVAYGELEVVKGVSFAVERGEIVTMLGSNGAGKTTTLRSLAGLAEAGRGSHRYSAAIDIAALPRARDRPTRARAGARGASAFSRAHGAGESGARRLSAACALASEPNFPRALSRCFRLFPRVRRTARPASRPA